LKWNTARNYLGLCVDKPSQDPFHLKTRPQDPYGYGQDPYGMDKIARDYHLKIRMDKRLKTRDIRPKT